MQLQMLLLVLARLLNDNCTAISSNATSITFMWSSATPTANVKYRLAAGTAIIANTTATYVTIDNLAAGANYSYSLYASRGVSDTICESVICTGWTGKML